MRIILAFLILSVSYTGTALAQVYVANNEDETVSILFDTNDGSTITVDLDLSPDSLAVSPDGDFVYVAGGNRVAVIQTSDNKVVDTVDVGSFTAGIAVTPDGSHVYVSNSGNNNVSVIQTSDNTVVDTVDVGKSPGGIAVSVNGDYVFVANADSDNISVIQTSDNKNIMTVPVGKIPFGVTTNAATSSFLPTVFVTNSGSNNMVTLIAEPPFNPISFPPAPLFVAVGECPVGVAGANTTTAEFGLAAFVANGDSNTVSIVNVFENAVIGTTTVGQAPVGIAATPGGDTVYVTNSGSNTLSELCMGCGFYGVSETYDTGEFPVAVAITPDTDTDGVSNKSDTDSDNDGITNNDETSEDSAAMTNAIALRNEDPKDADGDGIANLRDLDSDGDCIPDHFEAGGGNDSNKDGLSDNFVDADMDGLHDEHDPDQTGNNLALPDTDNDGIPDFLDRDSDNDGKTDAEEAGGLDEDADGIHDESEDLNRDGLADACHPDTGTPLPILDLNSNGVPDFLEAESNDGSNSCSLAAPGAEASFALYLLIPAFILINRLWRRRTN
ncbi:MAG: hypothetical protein DHS20C13_09830 [Thermodesulfobacteriota bacterium]|nr:MAG: hypothetical protein DHS20C13_09830 [Thermodesulfobacteriota bacterium]